MLKIAIGSDHAGFDSKEEIIKFLINKNYQVVDMGPDNGLTKVDYPDYAKKVCDAVITNQADFGVVICYSGEGICMASNKIKGIRCGIAYNDEVTELMRMHNDANVIAFGQHFMSKDEMIKRLNIFLTTKFEGGRHINRVDKIKKLENI